jgi:Ca2+-binding RTX toxin-like protein
MYGGAGNDSYTVDSTNDVIIENAAEGYDVVRASASYTLAANIEDLILNFAVSGTGNALANNITGDAGNNTLRGMDGDDQLTGLVGNDTLEWREWERYARRRRWRRHIDRR